jgi:pimeloyl-ACP methyl ester carboxylesterase
VPLNYSDPNGPPATIAIIRQQANVTDPALYRGPILFNPGGPGDSGVDFLLTGASLFAAVLGPEFDIVSFDPRGAHD